MRMNMAQQITPHLSLQTVVGLHKMASHPQVSHASGSQSALPAHQEFVPYEHWQMPGVVQPVGHPVVCVSQPMQHEVHPVFAQPVQPAIPAMQHPYELQPVFGDTMPPAMPAVPQDEMHPGFVQPVQPAMPTMPQGDMHPMFVQPVQPVMPAMPHDEMHHVFAQPVQPTMPIVPQGDMHPVIVQPVQAAQHVPLFMPEMHHHCSQCPWMEDKSSLVSSDLPFHTVDTEFAFSALQSLP